MSWLSGSDCLIFNMTVITLDCVTPVLSCGYTLGGCVMDDRNREDAVSGMLAYSDNQSTVQGTWRILLRLLVCAKAWN